MNKNTPEMSEERSTKTYNTTLPILARTRIGARYAPGGGPAELRIPGKGQRRQRNNPDKGGKGCWRPSSWWGSPLARVRAREGRGRSPQIARPSKVYGSV